MSDAGVGISSEDFLREQSEISADRREMPTTLMGQTIARKGQFAAFASTMGRPARRNGDHGVPVPSCTVLHSLHLLLRPLGQIILANAVAELAYPKDQGGIGLSLETIFKRLSALDEDDGFESHWPRNVWWGVTYTPTTNRILNRGKSWGHKLLVHMVAGTRDEEERRELWWDWVSPRGVDLKRKTWKNQQGRVARFDYDVAELPEPIEG